MIWPKSLTATAGLALDAIRTLGAVADMALVPIRVRVLRFAALVNEAQERGGDDG